MSELSITWFWTCLSFTGSENGRLAWSETGFFNVFHSSFFPRVCVCFNHWSAYFVQCMRWKASEKQEESKAVLYYSVVAGAIYLADSDSKYICHVMQVTCTSETIQLTDFSIAQSCSDHSVGGSFCLHFLTVFPSGNGHGAPVCPFLGLQVAKDMGSPSKEKTSPPSISTRGKGAGVKAEAPLPPLKHSKQQWVMEWFSFPDVRLRDSQPNSCYVTCYVQLGLFALLYQIPIL